MEIVSPAIDDYLRNVSPIEDPILVEMQERARRESFPIVGPLVGRILYQLVRISGAKRVLELGSGFGYSAYWFGLALGKSGELVLTEFSEKNMRLAREYFQRGRVTSKLEFRSGDALNTLQVMEGTFDIIFNDVDKHQYPNVFRQAETRLRPGGLLISDNILWHGKVLDKNPDENTRGILDYTRLIFDSPDFFSSIIPVRDGISVSVKK